MTRMCGTYAGEGKHCANHSKAMHAYEAMGEGVEMTNTKTEAYAFEWQQAGCPSHHQVIFLFRDSFPQLL